MKQLEAAIRPANLDTLKGYKKTTSMAVEQIWGSPSPREVDLRGHELQRDPMLNQGTSMVSLAKTDSYRHELWS